MKIQKLMTIFVVSFIIFCTFSLSKAGNITVMGPTGMFLNPVAEVQGKNSILSQACWLNQKVANGRVNGAQGIVSYTAPSNTEIAGMVLVLNPPEGDDIVAPGAYVRQLIIERKDWRPAVAAGGMFLESDDIQNQTAFAAVRQPLTPEDASIPVFLNVGMKWTFVRDENDGTIYGGVEVQLNDTLSIVAETSGKTDFDEKTPYAAGVQYKPFEHLGLSLAAINAGGAEDVGFYFGIGYAFLGD